MNVSVSVCVRERCAVSLTHGHLAVILVLQPKVVPLHQVEVVGHQVKQQLARRPLLGEHKEDGGC